jgi:WD40 repeat protein
LEKNFEESKLCPGCNVFIFSPEEPNRTIERILKEVRIACVCKSEILYCDLVLHMNSCDAVERKAYCVKCYFMDSLKEVEKHVAYCEANSPKMSFKKLNNDEFTLKKINNLENKINEITDLLEKKDSQLENLRKEFDFYQKKTNEKINALSMLLNGINNRTDSNISEKNIFEIKETRDEDCTPKEEDKEEYKEPLKEFEIREEDRMTSKSTRFELNTSEEFLQPKMTDSAAIKGFLDGECSKIHSDIHSEYDGIGVIQREKHLLRRKSGLEFTTFQGVESSIFCLIPLIWDRDRTSFASGSEDNTIIIWNTSQIANSRILNGHIGSIKCLLHLRWEKDQVTLVSGSDDNTIRLWNIDTEKCIMLLKGHTNGVHSLVQRDNNTIISGGGLFDSTIKIWNLSTESCIKTFSGHIGAIRCLVLHNLHLVSGSDDGTLKIWNYNKDKAINTFNGHTNGIHCVIKIQWELNNDTLVSGSWDNTIRVWNTNTGAKSTLYGHTNGVNCLVQIKWKIDDKTIASGAWDKTIRLWNLVTEQCIKVISGHTGCVKCIIQFDLDCPILVSGSYDRTIRLWKDL